MFKTILKAIYSAFISIVLISIILAGWTSYTFISQASKSSEIINVLKHMYSSQKSFIADVYQLSKILIKDTSESIVSENNSPSSETELLLDLEDNSQLEESPIIEDNGDNPLGIFIEPSLPEVLETQLPETNDDPLANENIDISMNEMEKGMGMDMNS